MSLCQERDFFVPFASSCSQDNIDKNCNLFVMGKTDSEMSTIELLLEKMTVDASP
jgi:hypothetical protein